MGSENSGYNLNVYKGKDAVKKYYHPESSPPLPLIEIPDHLNPHRGDGVRIYAKMMTMHPANNVKAMPTMNLLEKAVVPGKTRTIAEYSSGSTVLSMSLIASVFYGIRDVHAVISNKTSLVKIRLMQLFNIHITLFGGPSQPEPLDERGGIRAAQRLAQESDSATIINPNQYENDDNWKSHVKWTGPQILKQLPEINIICAGMGTSGTMTGLGTYFKQVKPAVKRVGVCTAAGDRVPGPRSYALLAPVEFPWNDAIDDHEEVGSLDAYSLSLDLIRAGLVCGPSSGLNLKGLFQFIKKYKVDSRLSEFAGDDGEIHCVFLCCDLPYQYVSEYAEKLGEKHFPNITNEELLGVDLYRYDEAWEQDASDAISAFFGVSKALSGDVLLSNDGDGIARPKAGTTIIDLRQAVDFEKFHLPSSTNVPFVQADAPSPFGDAAALESLWPRLEETFKVPNEELQTLIQGKRILVLCYDGDSSRVANSVLRAKGYDSSSIRGGFKVLERMKEEASRAATRQQDQLWLRLSDDEAFKASGVKVAVQPLGSATG